MEFAYIDHIKQLMKQMEIEYEAMEQATNILCDAIEKKQSIFIFGASHAGILAEEMFYRAGGLVVMNPIFGRELMLDNVPITITSKMERLDGYGSILASKTPFKAGDVLLLHSVSGRNSVTIELAIEAKKRGVTIIGITNMKYSKSVNSRHASKLRLFEICDLVIDNHGEIGDAGVAIEGMKQKVGPTSTVIGAMILNSLVVAVTQTLVNRGMKHPPVFYSANLDGGDSLNRSIFDEYKEAIHYRFL